VTFTDTTTGDTLGTVDLVHDSPTGCVDRAAPNTSTARPTASFSSKGAHKITAQYVSSDQNAWLESQGSTTETINATGVTTTVKLRSDAVQPLNQETTLTAMVDGCDPNNVEPFGTVDFYDQTTKIDLGTADVNPASCDATGFGPPTASLKTHFSKAGAHTIKLTFTSQDQNDWLNSTSSKAITAKYIGVKTSVTLQSPTTQPLNDSTTLTAVVDGCGPNNLEPFGTVDFYDTTTKTDLGTADVNPASCDATGFGPPTASLKTHFSKAGAHTIKLTFTSQDQNDWLNSTSSKAITAKYVGVKTTIKLASDDIQPLNTETTLTAVVEGCDRDNVEPFGTVDFYDTTTKTDLGTADVNPTFCTGPGFGEPTANLKTHFTKAGAHTIKLTFISQDQNDWLDSTGSGSVTVVAQQPT
jgi:hypothetical protein